MILELEEGEIVAMINVLGQLPTSSAAWPLREKIRIQLEAQMPSPAPAPEEVTAG